jgi:spore coat polysaccharide biosynthesis protein SpsF (cytidylyltransferase family)
MIAAIVQARLGSSRFPNKVIKPILGQPMICHILNRLSNSKMLEKIIVAIPDSDKNSVLEQILKQNDALYFFGNEQDVLDRYYKCAKFFNVDIIVRITADDPFKDSSIIDKAIDIFIEKSSDIDYVANCSYDGSIRATYPEGLDVEVFSFSCLDKIWKSANKKSEREHVTPFLFNNKSKFKIAGFENNEDLSNYRWTVDYEIDYLFAKEVYSNLFHKNNNFLMNDIIKLLNQKKSLSKMNNNIVRHEGYKQSLKEEL